MGYRRKFRGETSNNMDRWKEHCQEEAEPGRNSDVEKVRREKIRGGDNQKKEDTRLATREALCFSIVLWLRRVEK